MTKITRKYKIYNNGVEDIRVYDDELPPEGFIHGSIRKPWNKGLTKETDSRIKGMVGEENPMFGKQREAWNKGLTKETDERMRKASESHKGSVAWNKGLSICGHKHSEDTKEKIRKTHLSDEFKLKRYNNMLKNNTLGINQNTKAEIDVWKELIEQYGEENITHPYMDARYPFACDFYISSEDLFIEVHGNWTHGGRPFDPNDLFCQEQLKLWQDKSKTSDYYKNAIYTWTDLDVRKQQIAKENNLNFKVIYYKYR